MGACFSEDRKAESRVQGRGSSYRQSRDISESDSSSVMPYSFGKDDQPDFRKKRSRQDNTSRESNLLKPQILSQDFLPSTTSQSRPELFKKGDELLSKIIKNSRLSSKIIQRQKELQNQRQKQQATQLFVQKSSIREGIDSPMVSLISDRSGLQNQEVRQIISHYGSRLEESKLQRQFLTSSQFKQKLAKVRFIEKQPTLQYKIMNQKGVGSICKVYKVSSIKNPSKHFAVRIIPVENQILLEKIKEEIAVMNLCKSQNIIKYYFTYYYEKTLFMFIQYMEKGSLNNFIHFWKHKIDQDVIAYIIKQILKGLQVIHRRRQVHRDLKSDNILTNQHGEIKIADFGYALQLTKEEMSSKELAGTPAWMAPELIKKEDYTQSVDIWSLGIILVELCQGQPRYLRMKPLMAMIMIATKDPETVSGRSPSLENFLARCLRKQPWQRAKASELLLDPFITGIGYGFEAKNKFIDMQQEMSSQMEHHYI